MPAGTNYFQEATEKLNLTPQEQQLYRHHLDNLWGSGGVNNDDGSRSTVYSTVEQHGDLFYNVPTVWNGQIETEKWTRADGQVFDVPNKTALANINQVGWENYQGYPTPKEAEDRYDAMHQYMERDTDEYFTNSVP